MLRFFKSILKINEIMSPRNILSLTSEEKRKFLDSFDHVFSDIDGVVWNLSHTVEGSDQGFNELRKVGKQLTFITNNSVRPEEQCIEKLRKNNIDIEADHLIHPAKMIAEYLKSINFEGLIYLLAGYNYKTILSNAGFKIKDGPNAILKESIMELMSHIVDQDPVKAVIIDFDFNITYAKLTKANFYLRQPDCLLIGGATDNQLPITKDLSILGPGPFVKVLEQASGKELLTFGKPGKLLADLLMQRFHIPATQRVLMIGDMLEQDVRFARVCGFQSLLVLSGGCSYEQLMAQTEPSVIPDYYAHSMLDFVEFMKDVNKSNV